MNIHVDYLQSLVRSGLSSADKLPARSDELIRIFTRFEYALKAAGYAEAKGESDLEIKRYKFANKALKKLSSRRLKITGFSSATAQTSRSTSGR